MELVGGDANGPLPTKEHLRDFLDMAHTFNYPEGAKIPDRNFANLQKAKTGLTKIISAALGKAQRSQVLEALDYAISYTGLKGYKKEYGAGPQPALSYFKKVFDQQLRDLRAAEHKDRVQAELVQETAKIEVEGTRAATEKKLGALDHRLNLGNQASQKRIESEPVRGSAPGRYLTESASDRFRPEEMVIKIGDVFVKGFDANLMLKEVPGKTSDDVRAALNGIKVGQVKISKELVHRIVVDTLKEIAAPRPEILERLMNSYDPDMPKNLKEAKITTTAEEIGATESEIELARTIEPAPKLNYRSGV